MTVQVSVRLLKSSDQRPLDSPSFLTEESSSRLLPYPGIMDCQRVRDYCVSVTLIKSCIPKTKVMTEQQSSPSSSSSVNSKNTSTVALPVERTRTDDCYRVQTSLHPAKPFTHRTQSTEVSTPTYCQTFPTPSPCDPLCRRKSKTDTMSVTLCDLSKLKRRLFVKNL